MYDPFVLSLGPNEGPEAMTTPWTSRERLEVGALSEVGLAIFGFLSLN